MLGMDLIPRWLHKEYDMPEDEMHIPPIAKFEPEFTPQDEATMVIQKSAALWIEAKHIQQKLQIELAEAAQKIEFLEKENADLRKENTDLRLQIMEGENNIASERAVTNDYRVVMEYMKKAFDMLGTKAPAKKMRNGRNGDSNAQKKTAAKATEATEETIPKMDK